MLKNWQYRIQITITHRLHISKTGVDLQYSKVRAPLDGFEQAVQTFFTENGVGMNVTVPFKEQAFALCDALSERAKIAKSVNTLYMQDGKLIGDNTDGQGLVDALKANGLDLNQASILIIGAGGATRGVIYPLAQAGVAKITIANRTLARAEQLINDIQAHVPTCQLSALSLDQLQSEANAQFDIVVNATSASLSGDALQLPVGVKFNFAYEMAYGKASTFIDQAIARGVPYADGYSMLVAQAIEAFAIWNGVRPELIDFL